MARQPGTFFTSNRAVAELLLKRMSKKEAILLYLDFKESFRLRGATSDELLRVLDCALKTLDNTLRALKKSGEIVQKDKRFFSTLGTEQDPDCAPKQGPNLGKSPPTKPEQDGLFEEYEVRGRTLKTLSRAEDEKNQKLELLNVTLGDYVCILDEVAGRREKWLELPQGAIAGAIEQVTGNQHFITDLKLELDKLANVKAPQSAKRSEGVKRSTSETKRSAQEVYTPVLGEKSAQAVQVEKERIRLEDEAAHEDGWTERAKRFLEDAATRAERTGGQLPKGRSPPSSVTRGDWFARLRLRKVAYG